MRIGKHKALFKPYEDYWTTDLGSFSKGLSYVPNYGEFSEGNSDEPSNLELFYKLFFQI